jgi:hypothetical protein
LAENPSKKPKHTPFHRQNVSAICAQQEAFLDVKRRYLFVGLRSRLVFCFGLAFFCVVFCSLSNRAFVCSLFSVFPGHFGTLGNGKYDDQEHLTLVHALEGEDIASIASGWGRSYAVTGLRCLAL